MKNKGCGWSIIYELTIELILSERVLIPKPNGDLRPLGIPSLYDRALQALFVIALEPEYEANFEENSYGFRPKFGKKVNETL